MLFRVTRDSRLFLCSFSNVYLLECGFLMGYWAVCINILVVKGAATDCSLSLRTPRIRILLEACEELTGDLGLNGGFNRVCRFPLLFTHRSLQSTPNMSDRKRGGKRCSKCTLMGYSTVSWVCIVRWFEWLWTMRFTRYHLLGELLLNIPSKTIGGMNQNCSFKKDGLQL